MIIDIAITRLGRKRGWFSNQMSEMGTGWFFNRGKASLDTFWLSDESLEASDNFSDPEVLTEEIVVLRLTSLGTTPSQGYG
jgi:hypothetical protein